MYFLEVEVAASETRSVVLDIETSRVVAEASSYHRWVEGLPEGHREQDPLVWIEALSHFALSCAEALGSARGKISAMSLSGSAQGIVVLDQHNRIVRPTKMQGDFSARKQAAEISRVFGGNSCMIEMVGNPLIAGSAVADIFWLKQHEPYHFQRAHQITIKDFLNYWLTGEIATEAGMAATSGMFDGQNRQWRDEICSFVDDEMAAMLPAVKFSLAHVGRLRKVLAESWRLDEGTIVAQGSGTQMLAALASGCVTAGRVTLDLRNPILLSGISFEPRIVLSGEVALLCDSSEHWFAQAHIANAVTAPEMIRRHYGWSAQQAERMVAPGAEGLLFLTCVNGEKAPSLPDAKGLIQGITLDNFTPQNLARATAEGVSLAIGYGLGRMRELGFSPNEVQMIGAGSASAVNRQLLADFFGVPVVGLASQQGAAFGAAIHAALVFFCEHDQSLTYQDISGDIIVLDEATRCYPDRTLHACYQELISQQQYLMDTLHPAGFL